MYRIVSYVLLTASILLGSPQVAIAQPTPPPGASEAQIQFLNAALHWIAEVQAAEEGELNAAVLEANRVLQAVRQDSSTAARDYAAARRRVLQRRRDLEAARPPLGQGAWPTESDRRYFERLAALEEAEATLQNVQTRWSNVLARRGTAYQTKEIAEQRLVAARAANQRNRDSLLQAQVEWGLAPIPDGEFWANLTQAVTEIAKENGAESVVDFLTQPQTNLTLYYQTIDERKKGIRHTLNNPTNTSDTLPIGIYHIWYERSGVVKSERYREYPIDDKKEKVTVDIWP